MKVYLSKHLYQSIIFNIIFPLNSITKLKELKKNCTSPKEISTTYSNGLASFLCLRFEKTYNKKPLTVKNNIKHIL